MDSNQDLFSKYGRNGGVDSVKLSATTAKVSSTMLEEAPISKTMQYKKITKPLLERKRRARINACLDELKDIMTVRRRQIKVMMNPDHSHCRGLYRPKEKMCQNWKKPTYW